MERISPPQSEVLFIEQLTVEEHNTVTATIDRPHQTTIAGFSSQSGLQESPVIETNRQYSESEASFNAMLKRYSAVVTRPRLENRPKRHTVSGSNWKTQTMPSSVDSSQSSDLAAAVAMDYEVCMNHNMCYG